MNDESFAIVQDYKMTFGTPEGQRVLADLRKKSGFDASIHPVGHDGHTDIYEVMTNEGKRWVIIHILRQIAKDPMNEEQIDAIS